MPDNPKSVVAALAQVMAELPGIGKDQENTQQHFKYRGIEQITAAVQPLLAKHGIVVVPRVVSWERDELTINDKPWTDDRITVEYTFYGPDGESVTALVPGVGRDNSDKGSNKAMSGAFKYALLQVFCIGDDKDDADKDTNPADSRPATRRESQPAATPTASTDTATEPQLRKLHVEVTNAAKRAGVSFEELKMELVSTHGAFENMTKKQASALIDELTSASDGDIPF